MTSPSTKFWQGRRVLLTGHTGFKGGWLACWLNMMKAKVYGYSLAPATTPNLYTCLQLPYEAEAIADLRDYKRTSNFVDKVRPEFVFHLAAQPLVRRGYHDPIDTFSTNIMGTTNLLEGLRKVDSVEAIVVVTSDKAYENIPSSEAYEPKLFREGDTLGGVDPYSASKSAQEIITRSFSESYFRQKTVRVATARAGNVIGGGDWSEDRLMTDILKAVIEQKPIPLRHPSATRPWQHVLEPLAGYLLYAEALASGTIEDATLNFGPSRSDTVIDIVETVLSLWPNNSGWIAETSYEPETQALELDPTRALSTLGWKTRLTTDQAVSMAVTWHKSYRDQGDAIKITKDQISMYEEILKKP